MVPTITTVLFQVRCHIFRAVWLTVTRVLCAVKAVEKVSFDECSTAQTALAGISQHPLRSHWNLGHRQSS